MVASFIRKDSSSVSETKRDTILFSSEVNSAGYSEIEEQIELRKNHYTPSRYMLTSHNHAFFVHFTGYCPTRELSALFTPITTPTKESATSLV